MKSQTILLRAPTKAQRYVIILFQIIKTDEHYGSSRIAQIPKE
jgi:hypothetical protein